MVWNSDKVSLPLRSLPNKKKIWNVNLSIFLIKILDEFLVEGTQSIEDFYIESTRSVRVYQEKTFANETIIIFKNWLSQTKKMTSR